MSDRSLFDFVTPTPETSPRLGSVPKRNRWEVRHVLQEVHNMALELRHCMPFDRLSLAGAIADLDSIIGKLEHCKRELGQQPGRHLCTDPDCSGECGDRH